MIPTPLARPAARAVVAGLACLAPVAPGFAQEPDSARVQDSTAVRDSALVADSAFLARPQPTERCVLQWEPLAPDTEGLSLREGGEAHVTHVSGRMLWTCGTATMEADSAVKYDRARRVDLIGNVVYRDTTRTLRSRFLTYFELPDLVIATGEVELERIADASTLAGPRVEFLRAVSGVDELTIATGRPHMQLYPEGEERTNPFQIDADRTVFAGEEEARAYGDVVIVRDDLDAAADSAYLRRVDETGVLWGSPWVDAEGVRLSGDTIRFASEDDELRDVHAVGDGHAIGESFEVRAEKIDIELVDREVETVWAHGEGGSEAVSGTHHVYGDSLRFAMFAGRIDTLYAVGEAAAVQADGPVALARLDAPPTPGAVDSAAVAGDSAGVAGDPMPGPPGEDTTAVARDTTEAGEPPADTTAVTRDTTETAAPPADTTTAVGDSAGVRGDTTTAVRDSSGVTADTTRAPPDTAAARRDTTAATGEARADSARAGAVTPASGGSVRPRMSVDGRSNWVRGDTLIAIFERDPLAVPDSAGSGALPAADSLAVAPAGEPIPALPPADSLTVFADAETGAVPADTASDPRMERLIAIGHASSFYRQVRDTAQTSRPSRNYMIGKRIDVLFQGGEPKTVKGTEAIGIYLEPEEGVEGETPPADSGAAAGDSLTARPDSIPPDSLTARPDSIRPDSLARPHDPRGPADPGAADHDALAAPPGGRRGSPESRIRRRDP